MSAALENQLAASLVKETRDADTDWPSHAARLVDMIPFLSKDDAINLLTSKLRFSEAIGFGRGLNRAEEIIMGRRGENACGNDPVYDTREERDMDVGSSRERLIREYEQD
jgi:hypothetical protein